ncbi:hypothetical protein [Nocardia jejuensis]|uniref:hypothetical protein n=1 Tax=Nocardia jejuensis TaxID=328049 RepID=UPI000A6BD84C|nr:hypothetical protein [Nocardia jejuensis]
MTDASTSINNHGPLYVAHRDQVFNTAHYVDGFVRTDTIAPTKFGPCSHERFIPRTGEWFTARSRLELNRLLVLRGERGTGRQTAALWLLQQICGIGRIWALTPEWTRPRKQLLPNSVRGGEGYLMDMSEPTTEQASEDFAVQLQQYAENNNIFLVVTTTRAAWTGAWTTGVDEAVIIDVESPSAKQLVIKELSDAGVVDASSIVADPEFSPVFESHPTAADARRLVEIIRARPDGKVADIVAEYTDWRGLIDAEIPDGVGARALWWSCAFCEGGRQTSIVGMAESLRKKLGEKRSSLDVLTDLPTTRRLQEAKLANKEGGIGFESGRPEFDAAVRRHLWEEYNGQTGLLGDWIVGQAGSLPVEDAKRVADAVFDLVVSFRDDALLRKLRDALVGQRRSLAVEVFTRGALDPRFGPHMRACLNTWARSTSSSDIDLVTEICGGRFGEVMPEPALVRLRHTAQRSAPGSVVLAGAVNRLAVAEPSKTLQAICAWMGESTAEISGVHAFLALASDAEGARLLSDRSSVHSPMLTGTDVLVRYFGTALRHRGCESVVNVVLEQWAGFAEDGVLDWDATVDTFGVVLAPRLKDNILQRFFAPGQFDDKNFWAQVLAKATEPLWNQG